jgi:5-methylcytosine-specific restriction endonuclease McrA
MKVLALSSTYEPLGVINWEKAITLLCSGKVFILSEYEREVRSPNHALKVPSVIAFRHNKRARTKTVRFSRNNIWIRDEGRCQYCGTNVSSKNFTLDHVVPRANGGSTIWTNVVACCYACNQRKGDKTPAQAGMRLLRQPVKPQTLPYVYEVECYKDYKNAMPESWKFWLGEAV